MSQEATTSQQQIPQQLSNVATAAIASDPNFLAALVTAVTSVIGASQPNNNINNSNNNRNTANNSYNNSKGN